MGAYNGVWWNLYVRCTKRNGDREPIMKNYDGEASEKPFSGYDSMGKSAVNS